MSSIKPTHTNSDHWRSLGELEASPKFQEYMEKEFPGVDTETISPFSRRRFMQLMGASMALAGAQSCRWEKETILPFQKRPEGRMPGVPSHYATSFELAGIAQPLVVTNYDGRPIKVEGNPQHPASGGATSAYAQGTVLGLYDPDRSQSPAKGAAGKLSDAKLADFEVELAAKLTALKATKGAGLAILSEASSSPTFARLRAEVLENLPEARFVEFESITRETSLVASKMAFGKSMRAHYDVSKADCILAVDEDILREHPDALRHARAWATRRDPKTGKMNRVYAVESSFSSTGSVADHRLPLRSDQGLSFLVALEARLKGDSHSKRPAALADADSKKFFDTVAKDLLAHKGVALVCVGSRQSAEAQAVGHRINAFLGAIGKTIRYSAETAQPDWSGMVSLCADMKAGKVSTLLVLGGNPAYSAPVDLGFAEALSKVETSVHLSEYRDETSLLCSWHVNKAHYLESWGDSRSFDGTICLTQPQIEPLFGSLTSIELLARVAGQTAPKGVALVRETHSAAIKSSKAWRKAIHDGFLADTAFAFDTPKIVDFTVSDNGRDAKTLSENGQLELVLLPDARLFDGRFANNGWLQETPDFITKLTWDNAALFDLETAHDLHIENDTLVDLTVDGRTLRVAAYVLPGQARGSVGLYLGFGRKEAGQVGGSVKAGITAPGFDAGALRSSKNPWVTSGLKVKGTHEAYTLASTQEHWAIDKVGLESRQGRISKLIRGADLEEYKRKPDFVKDDEVIKDLFSLWERPKVDVDHKWGMAIDLNKCMGCNACVIGCTAENNVAVVGKEQVINNRELHWLRIDRYFAGDPKNPRIAHQPMNCAHCETAPCEEVCPVAATTHSDEGLNDMIYNRCIGTRYCANNCPFKVRRFNYFDFNKDLDDPKNALMKMGKNPEVTVRARGVMEKCSFCVQRIQAGKITAKTEGNRPIKDGEIVSACQQACPTEAIVFGDLHDKTSKVAKAHDDPRTYMMLSELNITPRNRYMAQVRNPHPDLVSASKAEEHDEHH